jgi:hypothetical protein
VITATRPACGLIVLTVPGTAASRPSGMRRTSPLSGAVKTEFVSTWAPFPALSEQQGRFERTT